MNYEITEKDEIKFAMDDLKIYRNDICDVMSKIGEAKYRFEDLDDRAHAWLCMDDKTLNVFRDTVIKYCDILADIDFALKMLNEDIEHVNEKAKPCDYFEDPNA